MSWGLHCHFCLYFTVPCNTSQCLYAEKLILPLSNFQELWFHPLEPLTLLWSTPVKQASWASEFCFQLKMEWAWLWRPHTHDGWTRGHTSLGSSVCFIFDQKNLLDVIFSSIFPISTAFMFCKMESSTHGISSQRCPSDFSSAKCYPLPQIELFHLYLSCLLL